MSKKNKILFMEDEVVLAKIYKKNLEKRGYEVTLKYDIESSEEEIEKTCYDVFVLDHGVRGKEKTGLDLIPLITKKCQKSIIIMLSNFDYSELKEKCLSLGASNFFLKIDTPPKVLADYLDTI